MIKIPETITEEEFLKLLKATKKNRLKTAYTLGFYQCLRVSEVISLKKSDIDMERGFLHIKQGKGKKDRHVPIQPPVKFCLRYLPIDVSRQALHKSISTSSEKVLGKKLHFHTLRHSGATFYLNDKQVDIRHIQELLGHSRLSTTQIYTHINPQQLKSAFENAWK